MSTATQSMPKLVDILLVEDDEGDILLTKRALAKGTICNSLSVVVSGQGSSRGIVRPPGRLQCTRSWRVRCGS